jgi:uncharacterized membrane protein YtjA (UPF0391 family)
LADLNSRGAIPTVDALVDPQINLFVAAEFPGPSYRDGRGLNFFVPLVRICAWNFCDGRTLPWQAAVMLRLKRRTVMLGWAVTFLIVALVAALLGFGAISGVAIEAAKIVFFVAIVLFAISVIAGLVRGRPTVP